MTNSLRGNLFNIPNVVSMLRLLTAPIALLLAVRHREYLYLAAIALSVFTDLLDGFLARRLNHITALGARLDSWGDFTVYSTMAVSAFILWPETVIRHRDACLAIVLSFTVPTLIGLIKFKSLTSYHTWSVKLAVGVTILGYGSLFTGLLNWPFTLAAVLCVVAAVEETLITVILDHNLPDVRSAWQAVQYRRESRETQGL